MIHPTIRVAAAAMREGCPKGVTPAVVAAVLRAAGSEMADRGVPPELPYRWADDLDAERPSASTASTETVSGTAEAILIAHQRYDSGSCLCGWSELGKSYAAHQVRMLVEAGALR